MPAIAKCTSCQLTYTILYKGSTVLAQWIVLASSASRICPDNQGVASVLVSGRSLFRNSMYSLISPTDSSEGRRNSNPL